jgi:hypothetical protein
MMCRKADRKNPKRAALWVLSLALLSTVVISVRAQKNCESADARVIDFKVQPTTTGKLVSKGRVHYVEGDQLLVALTLSECSALDEVRVDNQRLSSNGTGSRYSLISEKPSRQQKEIRLSLVLPRVNKRDIHVLSFTVRNKARSNSRAALVVSTVVSTPQGQGVAAMELDDCGLWADFDSGGPDVVGGNCIGGECPGVLFDMLHPENLDWKTTGEFPNCWIPTTPPTTPPPTPPTTPPPTDPETPLTGCDVPEKKCAAVRPDGSAHFGRCCNVCRDNIVRPSGGGDFPTDYICSSTPGADPPPPPRPTRRKQ